jgi:hypothetical protein
MNHDDLIRRYRYGELTPEKALPWLNRERLVPFRGERLNHRTSDAEAFYRGLERSGPKAVREFRMRDYEIK